MEKAESLALHLRRLGFKAAVLTVEKPENVSHPLREAFTKHGVKTFLRLNLKPKGVEELLEALRRYRRSFEVVSVVCKGKEVARQAAKDHRVDSLIFPYPFIRLLDEAEVQLARVSGAAVEFSLSMLLGLGENLAAYLALARRGVKRALKKRIPIVLSSGASNLYGLRAPRDLAAAAEILLQIPGGEALSAVSKTPHSILERNKMKLSGGFIEPGVRLLKAEGHG